MTGSQIADVGEGMVRLGQAVTGAADLFDHFRKIGRPVDRIGKPLGLHDEFGIFDLVEVACAVGQLHTGLEGPVTLPRQRGFPFARDVVQALDRKGLAAGTPGWRQGGQRRIPGHQALQRDRCDDVNQGVQTRLFVRVQHRDQRTAKAGIQSGILPGRRVRFRGAFRRHGIGLGLPGGIPAGGPGAVGDHGSQHQAASDRKADLE